MFAEEEERREEKEGEEERDEEEQGKETKKKKKKGKEKTFVAGRRRKFVKESDKTTRLVFLQGRGSNKSRLLRWPRTLTFNSIFYLESLTLGGLVEISVFFFLEQLDPTERGVMARGPFNYGKWPNVWVLFYK